MYVSVCPRVGLCICVQRLRRAKRTSIPWSWSMVAVSLAFNLCPPQAQRVRLPLSQLSSPMSLLMFLSTYHVIAELPLGHRLLTTPRITFSYAFGCCWESGSFKFKRVNEIMNCAPLWCCSVVLLCGVALCSALWCCSVVLLGGG